MDTKVFKVDNLSVVVYGTPIDGLVSFAPPQAANREKSAVTTTEGCVGYTSKIIPGETEFTITTMSDQYLWLCSIVDTVQTGTVIFSMPGATYTMYNAVISTVKADEVSDETPTATVSLIYTRVQTATNSYSD